MSERAEASVFSHGAYRAYLATRFLASIAVQMMSVAIGVQVYALTGRPMDLALVGLAQFLPMMALTFIAGRAADTLDRRLIATGCDVAFAAAAGALALISYSPRPSMPAIYLVLALLGAGRAFYGPSVSALLPSTVPHALLPRAVGWQSVSWQVAAVGGPALAGAMYGGSGSPRIVYFTALTGCALAGVLMLGVRGGAGAAAEEAARERARTSGGSRSALVGLRYVVRHPLLLPALLLDFFAVFLGGATALIPVYARDILREGPFVVGVLRAASAVGAAIAAVVLARTPVDHNVGRRLFVAVGIFGAATVVFGVSRSLWLSVAALVVVGASDMLSAVVRSTLVQLATPPSMRGRVSAVNQLFVSASNELGEFESGMAAQWLGPVRAVVLGGLGTILVVVACASAFPALRGLNQMRDALARDE